MKSEDYKSPNHEGMKLYIEMRGEHELPRGEAIPSLLSPPFLPHLQTTENPYRDSDLPAYK